MNGAEEPVKQVTPVNRAQSSNPTSQERPGLLVLAAGMGTRFGGLKQIAPVNPAGEAILDYSVFDAIRAGFGNVVFVIRKEIEQAFKGRVDGRFDGKVRVRYAFQQLDSLLPAPPPVGRTKPWGTLQATLVGAELIDGPFAVINSDDFYGADSFRVLARHLQEDGARSAMVGFRLRNTLSAFGPVSRGLCVMDPNGLLTRVDEMKNIVQTGDGAANTASDGTITELSGEAVVSMNMWGFSRSVVPELRLAFSNFLRTNGSDLTAEAYLPEAVNSIVSASKAEVAVLHTEAAWCGMTYREDERGVVEHIRRLTAAGAYPETLWT